MLSTIAQSRFLPPRSAVITIPAKFKADQIAATKRAAQKAGIEHCELLQEPIAASMAYGLSASNKNGQWLVFGDNHVEFYFLPLIIFAKLIKLRGYVSLR